ncbi:flagellar basal-body rod protein FlgC [Gemmatimonadetes bacterium T265]|nr:flagellar basal-body rod protein FlgC [Gemmatimonadetes bacterium T265]
MPNPTRIGLLPAYLPESPVRPMFRSLAIAASGLSAQRARIETVASNLANAEVTRGADGQPYRRKVTVMQPATADTQLFGALTPGGMSGTTATPVPPFGSAAFQVPALAAVRGNSAFGTAAASTGDRSRTVQVPLLPTAGGVFGDDGLHGVRVAGIEDDRTEGPLVYDPGHPDADANGYVRYPNVRTSDEMIDLLDARRVYEANATVFQSAKAMLKKAIDI